MSGTSQKVTDKCVWTSRFSDGKRKNLLLHRAFHLNSGDECNLALCEKKVDSVRESFARDEKPTLNKHATGLLHHAAKVNPTV